MRRWQKGVLWSVVALSVLAGAGVFALRFVIDDAKLKSIAQERVQQTWGRQLEVKSLTWNIFPYPQLHATGVTVSNVDWAQDKHIIEIDAVSARLALLPLVTGKAVIKRLDFDGLKANLEESTDGRRNWDLPNNDNDDTAKQRLPQTLKQVDLTALRVKNASIIYREAKVPAVEWQVKSLHADADNNLRNVALNLQVEREGHPLQLEGQLDDLSNLGAANAQTKGKLSAKSGEAAIVVDGMLPLTLSPRLYDVNVAMTAASMKEMFGFFNLKRGLPAPFKTSASLKSTDAAVTVQDFKLSIGKMNASGALQWTRATGKNSRPTFNAQVQADRVDMVQTFLDFGRPPLPPKGEGELFRDNPLPWPLLASLDGTQGKADVKIGFLNLRNGIDVLENTAQATFDNDRMMVSAFAGKMLGGAVSGDAVFDAAGNNVKLNMQLKDTSLGQWFKVTGKRVDMNAGAMQVDLGITTHGDSLKELAANATGPMNIRIGPAKILSPKAGHAEFWLTGLFSAKNAEQIDMSCASLRLPFQNGIARGEGIAGARSDASQLLTSGTVDLRQQTVDLRGRVRARSGVSLGISTFAGEVKIVGKIAKPQLNMDEAGLGGAIARVGAAILTSGISIIATSIWDGANPASDPCQVVFSDKAKTAKGTSRRHSAP
jgi:uncharacterized protein involved in outer membrane biogenesis